MRRVLLAIPDLIFNTRVADAVRALGGTAHDITATTAAESAAGADLAVVDTGAPGARAVIAALAGAVPVLAYGSHVDIAGQRAALQAGANRLVTRGKLTAELPALLQATARASTAEA